jgi:hypothetical protein
MKPEIPSRLKNEDIFKRKTIRENIDPMGRCGFWNIGNGNDQREMSIDKVIQCLTKAKKIVASSKKNYKKVWVDIEEEVVDDFGHVEHKVVVMGERDETDEEWRKGVEFEKIRLRQNLELMDKMINFYYNNAEGQKELAWLKNLKKGK